MIASKNLRYFPLKPRLERLFMSTKTSTLMTWHKDKRVGDGIMRHLTDSMAWKSFDELHPSFAVEPQGYIANECMTLCSRYLHRIDTKFNQPERNYDRGLKQSNGGLSLFCQLGKTLRAKIPFELEVDELEQAHLYILKNCDEVLPYLEFHVEDYDKKLRTQNCGVVVLGENDKDSENLDYYGVLTDVFELQFVMDRRMVLFRCNWFGVCDEIKGVKKDEFKMKPLKTENEADSSMKSTIRYTFFAPSAIGKGRGRGLKSLAERRDLSTKSFVSQSSDLVNEYIQEIETRMTTIPRKSIDLDKENKQINHSAHASTNLGKGHGQGLTNSTLFSSQGMITIPKNSINLEKEKMQINPSAYASTNLGKGQGQGLRNSTLFTSQGMIMIPKNSVDLEKENKLINPSAHASTNLGKVKDKGLQTLLCLLVKE
ncbi:hypothetical protein RDI58_007435 [Solanum bulbocastanum]|uniref:DUF4218 domain-containing protein n=1 Tax=Solanum bulbocastanum TaxID=147425 RepID=A0AAN8TZY9_SOLBU